MKVTEKTIRTIIELEKSHHAEFLVEADLLINYPDTKIWIEYQRKRIALMKELRNTMVGLSHP